MSEPNTDCKICRICLRIEAKVYTFEQYHLKSYYEEIMALKMNDDDFLPHFFCFECATLLHKFHKFKEKCYYGQKTLEELLWLGPITYESVHNVDRKFRNLQSPLATMILNERIRSFDLEYNDPLELNLKVEVETTVKVESVDGRTDHDIEINNEPENEVESDNEPLKKILLKKSTIVKKEKKLLKKLPAKKQTKQCKKVEKPSKNKTVQKEKKEPKWRLLKNWGPDNEVMRYHMISKKHMRFLDPNTWKILHLNEDEALKQFAAKANDSKYLSAPHKCTKCFKSFSKLEMLTRHLKLRHSESLGSYECRLCHMRYRIESGLRCHMRQHFTVYECLQCHLVSELEGTVKMHDEYHKGVTRKCIHCGEEYTHLSSYYTHLRTAHRSEYVCTKCGVSFTSETGLKHHRRMTHLNDDNNEAPVREDTTYCSRCDIKFETKIAYDKHMVHSALHAEDAELGKSEIASSKEIESPPTKIIKDLKRKHNEPLPGSDKNQWKKKGRVFKLRKKPTTCYQCGRDFPTQKAYTIHHLAEHPGTSLYPPTQRHICEICGMSLTPGSWPTHINMHTREKLFACDTCGREFHNKVHFKAHLVTHTDESPYSCNLCGKRFRQQGSVYTHYRTFHLKQPYPKRSRNRRFSADSELPNLLQKQQEKRSRLNTGNKDSGQWDDPTGGNKTYL